MDTSWQYSNLLLGITALSCLFVVAACRTWLLGNYDVNLLGAALALQGMVSCSSCWGLWPSSCRGSSSPARFSGWAEVHAGCTPRAQVVDLLLHPVQLTLNMLCVQSSVCILLLHAFAAAAALARQTCQDVRWHDSRNRHFDLTGGRLSNSSSSSSSKSRSRVQECNPAAVAASTGIATPAATATCTSPTFTTSSPDELIRLQAAAESSMMQPAAGVKHGSSVDIANQASPSASITATASAVAVPPAAAAAAMVP